MRKTKKPHIFLNEKLMHCDSRYRYHCSIVSIVSISQVQERVIQFQNI
jgi:hypothetical protein